MNPRNPYRPNDDIAELPEQGFDRAHYSAAPEDWTPAEQAEYAKLQSVGDAEILARAGGLGAAVIGRPLAFLATQVRKSNPEGFFGPAILDHDFDRKELAKRGLRREEGGRIVDIEGFRGDSDSDDDAGSDVTTNRGTRGTFHDGMAGGAPAPTAEELDAAGTPVDPKNLDDPRNPWHYVTKSGAKQLAMTHEISYKPRVRREELIGELIDKGVVPPPVPSKEELAATDKELDEE